MEVSNNTGKFDMDSQYNDSLNLTISELCRDIPDTEKCLSEETVYKKIKSSDGSGLINKLKSKLNFDVEKISENDKLLLDINYDSYVLDTIKKLCIYVFS